MEQTDLPRGQSTVQPIGPAEPIQKARFGDPRFTMEIAAIVGILVLLIGVPVVAVNRDLLFHRSAAKRARTEPPLPFLIIPSYLGASETIPSGVNRRNAPSFAENVAPDAPASFAPPEPPELAAPPVSPVPPSPPGARGARGASGTRTQWTKSFDTFNRSVEPNYTSDDDEADEMELAEELAPDATVVFNRPVDEPMQILPARLQVISGEPTTEDLLFFSRLGEQPRIVVGRDTGPPHRHITLRSPTVSRRHARIDFDSGSWTITNLSQTNPVIVNDRVLSNGGSARKLADGDRIELGEVALRFRSS